MTHIGRLAPAGFISAVSRQLLKTHWFPRAVVLDRWFLHKDELFHLLAVG